MNCSASNPDKAASPRVPRAKAAMPIAKNDHEGEGVIGDDHAFARKYLQITKRRAIKQKMRGDESNQDKPMHVGHHALPSEWRITAPEGWSPLMSLPGSTIQTMPPTNPSAKFASPSLIETASASAAGTSISA